MRDLRLTVGDYASPGGGQAPNPCVMGCAHLFLGSLFVFGEGGGGSEGGRVESRLAVSAVLANFRGSSTVEPRARLREALEHAGQVLYARSRSATAFQSAWARCVAVLVRKNRMYAARVGDLYVGLVRGSGIVPLFTVDTESEGSGQLLGQPDAVTVQVREEELELQAGDRFVLANRALVDAVSTDEVGRLASSLVPAVAARRLVEAVDREGTNAPVSVQVVQAGEMPLGTSEPVPPPEPVTAPPPPAPARRAPARAARSIAAPPVAPPPQPAPTRSVIEPSPVRRTTDSSSEIALEYSRHETRPNWMWFAGVALLGLLAFGLTGLLSNDNEDLDVPAVGGPAAPVTPRPGAEPGELPPPNIAEAFWSRVSHRLQTNEALDPADVQRWVGAPSDARARVREARAVLAALEAAAVVEEPGEPIDDPGEVVPEEPGEPVGQPEEPSVAETNDPEEPAEEPGELQPSEPVAPAVAPAEVEPAQPADGSWDPATLPRGLRSYERIFAMNDTARAADTLKRYIHARHRHVDRVFSRLDSYLDKAPAARSIAILRKLPAAKAGPKTRRWARSAIVRLKKR